MTAPSPHALRAYLEALPKTETHLHLEGALPYEYLHALDPAKYPAAAPFHAPEFRFNSFPEFEQTLLEHALAWFTSAERYHEAARAIFARHQTQNVRYVETSFHLPVTEFIGVPVEEIIRAIRSAVPPGLEVRLFAAMARNSYTPSLQPVIEGLVDCDGLTGIDLHGDEAMPTESWVAPLWTRARAAGLVTKCHAGEFDGAGRVREAIEELGATRIEHGVRAIEDPAVVALAVERGVTFDVCPLSNVKLRVVPDLARHPLRALLAAGIPCTVSTDDPLVFGYSLVDEYEALSTEAGFTREELTDLVRNGWAVARIPAEERGRIMTEIDRLAVT